MPSTNKLTWVRLAEPVMAKYRGLTDRTAETLALLDLTPRTAPDGAVAGDPSWVYSHQTIGFGPVAQRIPVLGLSDGKGAMPVTFGIVDRDVWNRRLRGTVLPVFEEGDQRISFPRLPHDYLDADHW
jgi:hypothetical protein